MRPEDEQESQRWLGQANKEMLIARDLDRLGHYSAACFHLQQTAEMALKAVLYAAGDQRVLGHSVRDLAEAVHKSAPSVGRPPDDARLLDKYYVMARYPNGVSTGLPYDTFRPEDSQAALKIAEQVLQFAETAIPRLLSE